MREDSLRKSKAEGPGFDQALIVSSFAGKVDTPFPIPFVPSMNAIVDICVNTPSVALEYNSQFEK